MNRRTFYSWVIAASALYFSVLFASQGTIGETFITVLFLPYFIVVGAFVGRFEKKAGSAFFRPFAPDKYSNVERLKRLLDDGALTKEEFEAEKANILK